MVDGYIIRGHRHDACFFTAKQIKRYTSEELKKSFSQERQGFLTSYGRYVNREEGRKLQEAAGIKSADPEGYRGKTLFSEDLY